MINATFKFPLVKVLAAGALLSGALFAGQTAMACQTTAWSVTSGAVAAGDPAPVESIARYQGLCGLEVTGQGYVQDNSPEEISRIRARFYALNTLDSGQSAIVYRGFSSEAGTGALFTVRLGTNGSVLLIDNASGQTVDQSGNTNWLSIEIDWAQGSGNGVISLSVNGQAPEVISNLTNTGSALQAVRLGNLNGAAGTLGFDSYESRRSTEVGRLCNCNANGSADNAVNIQDIVTVVNDAGDNTFLSPGTPDCNEDGQISIQDIVQTVNVAGTTGVCVF